MKRFFQPTHIFLLAAFLVTAACNDSYLNDPPASAIDETEFVKSKQDLDLVLNSAYDALSYGSVYGGQFSLISELMADGVNGNLLINGDFRAHYTRTTDIFLGTTRSMMHDGFKAVNRAASVMNYLENRTIPGVTEEDKKRYEGEYRFIRGMIHFDNGRFFGQPYGYTADNSHLSIPLRTSFSIDVVDRSTCAKLYEQVIADFSTAADLLPTDNGVYANRWAAKAMLAKVYFQMNDFAKAYEYSNDVISNGPFQMDSSFTTKYGYGNSQEVIFGLVSTDLINDNANASYRGYLRANPSTGVPEVHPSEDIVLESQNGGDLRGSTWYQQGAQGTICIKFNMEAAYTNPVIHLTELMLIRAESAAELGQDLSQAVADVNTIRIRAGLTPLAPSSTAEQIIANARRERHVELYFENNRLHELKRIAVLEDPALKIRGAVWNCNGLVCQFPDSEIKGNPSLVLNPTGGCN